MKYFNKIASVFFCAALGLTTLTGCEGGELFSVNAPDWIADKIDSISEANKPIEEVLENMQEDVYTFGKTDYSTGWWQEFSKYYQVEDGVKWNAVFKLNINPSADTKYYQNFVLIICNNENRGAVDYKEYGAIRFDNAGLNYNSEWGDYIDRSLITGSLVNTPDSEEKDANVQKLGGRVVLTVDRSQEDMFIVRMNNGSVMKTYTQPYELTNLNVDQSDNTIRCFLVAEGSYVEFQQSNVEPIGGYTSANDKQPLSMVLHDVPQTFGLDEDLDDVMAGVTATVTFEEEQVLEVTAKDLTFEILGDASTTGEKTLLVMYNKTFKGENASKPIAATATVKIVSSITSIEVTKMPTQTNYCIYVSEAVTSLHGGYPFNTTGLEVTGTDSDGNKAVIANTNLTFSALSATPGKQQVTITTENGKTTTVEVEVVVSPVTAVHPTPTVLGPEDNSGAWWVHFSDDTQVPAGQTYSVNFTNYSSGVGNWNNWNIVLRQADKTEFGVLRSDNYAWWYGTNPIPNTRYSGGQVNWATWLAAMNGADVTVYVTNCGDGTADVQAVMKGNDNNTYYQYYLGVPVVASDLWFSFIIDGSHLVFK